MPAGAHEQYLDFITRGAMLERGDGELQRELSHLLSALVQLQPLLRNLQQEVHAETLQRAHAFTLCRHASPTCAQCRQAVHLLSALVQLLLRNLQLEMRAPL